MKPPMQNPMQGGFGSFNPMQPMQPFGGRMVGFDPMIQQRRAQEQGQLRQQGITPINPNDPTLIAAGQRYGQLDLENQINRGFNPMQPSNLGGAMADFTAQMNMGTQAPGFGAPQTMQGGLGGLASLGGFGPMPFPMQGGIDPRANTPSGSFNPATGVYTPGTQPMPSMPFPAQPMTQPAPPPQQPMTYPTAPQQPMTQPVPPPQTQIPSPMPGAPNMQQVRSEAPRMQAARNMQRMRGYNR
jgi:hypothetical protein